MTTSLPSSSVRKGTSTSSISMPTVSTSGSASVSRLSTFTSSASSTYPTPKGTKSRPVGPAYGGDGGGNSCVVQAQSRPRRGSGCSVIEVDAQRGHESCAGNVTIPQSVQRVPTSCGSPSSPAKRPSATGTRAIRYSIRRVPTTDMRREGRRGRASRTRAPGDRETPRLPHEHRVRRPRSAATPSRCDALPRDR